MAPKKAWPIGARRRLAPIGPPFWLLAEKNLRVAAICFELRPRQILDPHRACYLGYILVPVGFRFRLVRYSGNLLSSRDAKLLFIPQLTAFLIRFSRRNQF